MTYAQYHYPQSRKTEKNKNEKPKNKKRKTRPAYLPLDKLALLVVVALIVHGEGVQIGEGYKWRRGDRNGYQRDRNGEEKGQKGENGLESSKW